MLPAVFLTIMGLFTYINEQDRVNMRKVNDFEVKEVFEEALQHDSTLMISETVYTVKNGWFKKPKEVSQFNIYHECFTPNGKPAYEARQQLSASGSKQLAIAYLYGIINGSLSRSRS